MVQLTGKNASCVVKRSSFPTLVVMVIRYQTGAWTSRSDIGGLGKRGTKSRPKGNTIHSVCIHSLMTGRSGGKREWRIHGQDYANWFSKSCLYCTLKHAIPHTLFRNITSIPVLTKKRILLFPQNSGGMMHVGCGLFSVIRLELTGEIDANALFGPLETTPRLAPCRSPSTPIFRPNGCRTPALKFGIGHNVIIRLSGRGAYLLFVPEGKALVRNGAF